MLHRLRKYIQPSWVNLLTYSIPYRLYARWLSKMQNATLATHTNYPKIFILNFHLLKMKISINGFEIFTPK